MSFRTLAQQEQQWRSQMRPNRRRAWKREPFSSKMGDLGKEGVDEEVLDDGADDRP